MPRKLVYFLIVATFPFGAVSFGQAQGQPGHKPATPSAAAPASGARAEFLEEIAYYVPPWNEEAQQRQKAAEKPKP